MGRMSKMLILFSLLALTPLIADDSCICSCSCLEGPCKGTVSLRHREANGIGYSRGYSSLDLFYTPSFRDNYYPFIDLRAHVFNDGKPAFNTGIGLRYLPECMDIVFGGNVYWDYRQANHSAIEQIGLGFEALWPRFDLSFNTYTPFNRHKKGYKSGFSGFKGNYAYFFRKYELAMWGGDLAFGYWLYKGCEVGLYAAVDGYYFHGDYGKHAGGGLLRTKLNWTDYFTLEGQVSCDSLFKWIGQGEISLHLPFGGSVKRTERRVRNCCELIDLEQQLTKRPDRFEIIVTTTHKKNGRALDPLTGKPLKFIFVDNTSSSKGTFESPHPTLAQALGASNVGDVIYIFPGNGKALTDPVVLQDRQWLVGSGAPIEMKTRFGNLVIPKQSATNPLISVTNANAVVLANQNTISGLTISSQGVGGSCIFSNLPMHNLTVLSCKLLGLGSTTGSGISANLDGQITIQDNVISANFRAINLDFSQNQSNVSIRRNRIGTQSPTIGTGILIDADNDAVVNVSCEDNQLIFQPNSVVGMGIFLRGFNQSSLQATLRNNQINSVGSQQAIGIFVNSNDSAQIVADIELNQVRVLNNSIGIAGVSSNSSLFNLRLAKNLASAPASTGALIGGIPTNDFSFVQQNPSVFFLQSPNGQLSGVQNINTGRFSQSGTLQFIPLQ